jgi:glycosyltransferase involved in cell wall biosynthesis
VSRDISFVIPCLNEGVNVQRTVESIEGCQPGDYEIIVVDNGSTDGCTSFMSGSTDPRRRLIRYDSRLGVAGARNVGAAFAEGDLLVFCDAHVLFGQPQLEPLLAPLRAGAAGIVGPSVSAWGNPHARGYGMFWTDSGLGADWLDQRANEPYPVPLLAGLCQGFRTQVFFDLGGYDPGMTGYGHEDVEICLRSWLYGLPVLVVPETEVSHLFRRAAPYEIDWKDNVYNMLRLAYVHFGVQRIERVLEPLSKLPGFDEAVQQLNASEVWLRRRMFEWRRQHTDDWFFGQFEMAV